ncbi:MAG: YceI family protein [Chitinophagales bacterium]|nr:YceI family protein [Chitinophagales bacterium]
MKQLFSVLLVTISALVQAQIFDADIKNSTVGWVGKKITSQHNGTVQLKAGFLGFKNGKLEAGKFEIDLNTITCKDISDPQKNADFVEHLKNDDFFSVNKFPLAVLTITRVVPKAGAAKGQPNYTFFGNLSIKGKNNPVEFPATVEVNGKTLTGKAKFSINRTKWDITYKSGTFFPSLADKAISDDIDFEVNIKAATK